MSRLAVVLMGLALILSALAACTGGEATPTEPLVGAYIDHDPNAEPVPAAFQFLVQELKKSHPDVTIKDIRKAESQVVAGRNIRLTTGYVKAGQDGTLVAVTYIPLGSEPQYQLTSISFDGRGSP